MALPPPSFPASVAPVRLLLESRFYFKHMLSLAIPHLGNPDWHYRRAALMFIGNSAEGCVMQYRQKFNEILPLVLALAGVRSPRRANGDSAVVSTLFVCVMSLNDLVCFQDANSTVREGVAMCLAQFCDHLPKTTLEYHGTILPVVFHFLEDADTFVKEKRYSGAAHSSANGNGSFWCQCALTIRLCKI